MNTADQDYVKDIVMAACEPLIRKIAALEFEKERQHQVNEQLVSNLTSVTEVLHQLLDRACR